MHVHVYKKKWNIHASLMGTLSHAYSFYPPIFSAHSIHFLDIAHFLRKIHKQCIHVTSVFSPAKREFGKFS